MKAKVHNKVIDGFPVFRPILSAIGTPTYKIAKFFIPVLKEILQQNFDCFIANLDIISLMTNILLDETINICLNKSYDKKQWVSRTDRSGQFQETPVACYERAIFDFRYNFLWTVRCCRLGFSIWSDFA